MITPTSTTLRLSSLPFLPLAILSCGGGPSGQAPTGGTACRLYLGSEVPGAPPLEAIVAALRQSPGTAAKPD